VYFLSTSPVLLHGFLSTVLENGGEGVMLRAPNTLYQHGISVHLLKLKVISLLFVCLFTLPQAQRDQEALVVDCNRAYELELFVSPYLCGLSFNLLLSRPDGRRFVAPIAPGVGVAVGDVVTFTYSFSKNEDFSEREGWTPLDPVVVRVRKDIIWEDVTGQFGTKPRERNANSLTQRLLKDPKIKHPIGHWTRDDNKNAKDLFIQFAISRNCSAQNPEFWYSVKRSELLKEKRTTSIIKNYGGSCAKTVLDLFPNIGLDPNRLFHHKGRRIRRSPLKFVTPKTLITPLKTSAIMKIWWKVHKNSVD